MYAKRLFACTILLQLYLLPLGLRAQKRAPDIIVTSKNDSLLVKTLEVGLSLLKYKNIEGDTTTVRTIVKKDIMKVLFGNGDIMKFQHRPDKITTPGITLYYTEIQKKTQYQSQIEGWTTEKLLAKQSSYRKRYTPQKVIGIAGLSAGGGFEIFGIWQFCMSMVNGDKKPKGSIPLVTGIGICTGIGMPFTFWGIRSKQKYRAITMELRKRAI